MLKFKNIINLIRKIFLFPFEILSFFAVLYSRILSFFDPNGSERYWEELVQKHIDSKINSNLKILQKNIFKSKKFNYEKKLNFFTPTKIASYRVKTLFSKEKDTLEWIDEYGGKNNIFYDIGANMGIYSLYYAHTFNGRVFSFEPSFRNLDLLIRNINLNKMQKLINVISNPLYDKESINFFSQDSLIAGEANGSTYGNQKLKNNFRTLSLKLDNLVNNKTIEYPTMIKIDVDGNEIEILKGSLQTLKNNICKTVLVEVRQNTKNDVYKILDDCGFSKKDQNEQLSDVELANEIWVKKL